MSIFIRELGNGMDANEPLVTDHRMIKWRAAA